MSLSVCCQWLEPRTKREVVEADIVDVDVEAKGKNLAVLKMREDFGLTV